MAKESQFAREERLRRRLRDDLPFFMEAELSIRTKSDGLKKFRMNRAQQHLHDRLEAQKAEHGYVRAVVLKGRQQGTSTYVAARFYHRTIHTKGLKTFIMTHHDSATSNLFEMVRRFHRNVSPRMRPVTGTETKSELYFEKLSSGYKVGTAGTVGVGRSETIQLFHGSEVAFWPFAENHVAGVMQAIVKSPGTEIILESTANGIGNYYHETWEAAAAGESDYQAVFLPWTLQDEYSEPVPPYVRFGREERDFQQVHGLTDEQLYWWRKKNLELGERLFKQEYPTTVEEAFLDSSDAPFIPAHLVMRARAAEEEAHGPLVVGVDPAGGSDGSDRTAICRRVGRKVLSIETFKTLDTMQLAGMVKRIIDEEKPAKVFVDANGIGRGVYDRVKEWGPPYNRILRPVHAQGDPLTPKGTYRRGYKNRRSEMWDRLRDWLEGDVPVDIPSEADLQRELVAVQQMDNSSGLIQLENKRQTKKRLKTNSTDMADALALTFAEPVYGERWKSVYSAEKDYERDKRFKEPAEDYSAWAE